MGIKNMRAIKSNMSMKSEEFFAIFIYRREIKDDGYADRAATSRSGEKYVITH